VGVRCALGVDDRSLAGEFLGQLGKQFPNDPEVMYVMVHAYSDLSSRAAADLGMHAPQSVEARKLNAEALEVQGKWDEAIPRDSCAESEPAGNSLSLGEDLVVEAGSR